MIEALKIAFINKNMKVVIALGGNALLNPKGRLNFNNYLKTVKKTCKSIAELIERGYCVIITHGNGTQVGDILMQQEYSDALKLPLDVCVAETQGQIDYLIQRELKNELMIRGIDREIISIITQVVVDKNDPSFKNPTKPIGPFFSRRYMAKGCKIKKINGKFRRVVPSPKPIDIVEKRCIKHLIEKGYIVISCGGGGVPVIKRGGKIDGVEVVIDKDRTSSLLASMICADILLIATNIDYVYLNYGSKNERKLKSVKLKDIKAYLKDGHFPPGSMGPKVESAIDFLESGGKIAIITSIKNINSAIEGKKGTLITR